MKPIYKVIIVIVAAIVLVAALGSAFNQIATSPILTKSLNTQDGDPDIPTDIIPDLNVTDPRQVHDLPDLNSTATPPELNYTIPNGTHQNITMDGTNVSGTVYNDLDGDGIVDPGEEQPDVGVQLYDQNGTLIATTQTDAGGNYNFTGVDPGQYNVSTSPGLNGNVTGGGNRTVTVDGSPQDGIDLNATSRPSESPRIDTITDITSPSGQFLVKKDVRFLVTGTVTTSSLKPVSGISVMVFVAASKTTAERHFIGSGVTRGGTFTANCLIPDEIQLGNYQLIARSLGNATYRPSESDPPVKIMDDTKLTIELPDRVVMGITYQCNFTLLENASSKPVPYASILLKESNQRVQTNSEGIAHSDVRWSTPGVYVIHASYAGNSTLYGTTESRTVTVLDVSVEFTPSYLVRGYDNMLNVLVHASELPVTFQTVAVYLDGMTVGAYVTDQEGRAIVTVPVPINHSLGATKMVFDIPGVKRFDVNITVKSTTTMRATLEGNQVNATLLDDHNQAMLSMPIVLQRADRTNIDMSVSKVGSEFSLGKFSDTDYIVNFTGSSIYQPSYAIVHYPSQGWGSGTDWIIIGVLGTVAALTLIVFIFRRRRSEKADLALMPLSLAPDPRLSTSPYTITFPLIAQDLPSVWGENEPMLFHVSGEAGEMHLDIDGNGFPVNPESSSGDYTVTLPKGDHLLSVSGPLGKTTVLVRSVDYREETVMLYQAAFDSWKTRGPDIVDSMSPRELQAVLERRLDRSQHGQLDVVMSLFEIAEFSQRPVGRSEYERMYRASKQVS